MLVAALAGSILGVRALDDYVTHHMGGLTLADPTPELLKEYGIAIPPGDTTDFGPIVVRVETRAKNLGFSSLHEGDWFAEAGETRGFRHGSVKDFKRYLGQWKACSTNFIPIVCVHGPKASHPQRRMEGLLLTTVNWTPFRPSFAPEWIPEGVFVVTTLAAQAAVALGLYQVRRKSSPRPRLLRLWVVGLMMTLLGSEIAALSVLHAEYALL